MILFIISIILTMQQTDNCTETVIFMTASVQLADDNLYFVLPNINYQ